MSPVDPGTLPACHAAATTADGPGSWLPAAAILLAGMLSTIMPCTVQMAVVLASLMAPQGAEGSTAPRWLVRLGSFLGGYAVTFLAAAIVAALLVGAAGWMVGVTVLQVAGGLILLAFGLQILGWLRLPGGGPCRGPLGIFLGTPYRGAPGPGRMGFSFALYCAGCCGPAALGSAMLLTSGGSAIGALSLLLAYALGMAIPFVILAAGFAFALRTLKLALRYAPLISMAGGAAAVLAGGALALRPLAYIMSG